MPKDRREAKWEKACMPGFKTPVPIALHSKRDAFSSKGIILGVVRLDAVAINTTESPSTDVPVSTTTDDVLTKTAIPIVESSTSQSAVPPRGGCRRSLTKIVNNQIQSESDPPLPLKLRPGQKKQKDPLEYLATRVSSKIEEGDFKGAIRLATSDDKFAQDNATTFNDLQQKHPSLHPDAVIPIQTSDSPPNMPVTSNEVVKAIQSFPCGSAGGPDGLRPQHLKDMISASANSGGEALIEALSSFISLILSGQTPIAIRPYFFGASLIALEKKGGGIGPIAVGCTLRRLAAKVASDKVMFEMASLLSPRQLGYGVSKGAEAAVHAARFYLKNIGSNKVFLKLDFKNAFNSIRRDRMLEAVHHLAPSIYSFVHSVYSSSSSLFWSDKIILSSEGVQQGDPLGPLLFCLTIHHMCSRLKSELCIFYLDDGTLGGLLSDVLHDVEMIKKEAGIVGLELNPQKSEVVGNNSELIAGIQSVLPGVRVVAPAVATLLGSPIGGTESLDAAIDTKTAMLKCLRERFRYITCHDAYLLLRHSLAIPKLLYLLRTSPCFLSPSLKIYDDELRATICSSFNIHLTESDPSWIQSILPVNCSGLGILSAVQLAPSAFLASAAASSELAHMILPTNMQPTQLSYVDEALVIWSQGCQEQPLTGVAAHHQKSWDSLRLFSMADTLLKNTTDELNRARLLAASCKESGAWLNALPITSLGLRMDDTTIRVSMGLRLGIPLCRNHICQHCGAEVSQFATHGLSCKRSAGRHYRHLAINDIIHRALVAAHVPSRLEPSGLYRSDGKRPDGITTVPWKCGQLLVWDATCPDTYAPSYSTIAAQQAGAVGQQAEDKKAQKYKHLSSHHFFTPVAIETSGVYGPRTADFLKELGHRLRQVSGEASSFHYLAQRLSVAIQRGNSASVMGTMDGDGEEFFV
ncbi:hypothetical protein EMCRGX_G030112 [Ephydatia muelleri]